MSHLKEHIIYKLIAVTLVMSILVPTTLKAIHDLEHDHSFESCDNHSKTHFHKLEKECDLCLFKLNTKYHSLAINYKLVKTEYTLENSYHLYSFLYNHKQLSFSLRGPPVSVYT